MIAVALWLALAGLPGAQIRVNPDAKETVRPDFRAVKAGETRVEGLLERVGCPPRRPVLFDLRLKDKKLIRYLAPSLTAVDYITYGPTIAAVQCGIRRPADHVYLTFTAGEAAGRVVAIEFLPR